MAVRVAVTQINRTHLAVRKVAHQVSPRVSQGAERVFGKTGMIFADALGQAVPLVTEDLTLIFVAFGSAEKRLALLRHKQIAKWQTELGADTLLPRERPTNAVHCLRPKK